MIDQHNEYESEKGYKKKLHKELFKTESEVKYELLKGDDGLKQEADSDASAHLSPRKRKRKRERMASPGSKPAYDYLEASVKQERHNTHNNSGESQDEKPKKKKSKRKKEQQMIEDKFSADETIIETKPGRKSSTNTDEEPIEDKFSAEKTIIETRPGRKSSTNMDEEPIEDKFSAEETIIETRPGRKSSTNMDEEPIDDKFSAEETIIETRPGRKSSTNMDEEPIEDKFSAEETIIETRPGRKSSTNMDEEPIEDKFSAEETIIETRPGRKSSTNMDEEPMVNMSKKEKKKKKKRKHGSEHDSENDTSVQEITLNGSATSDPLTQHSTYEDDKLRNYNSNILLNDSTKHKKLRKGSIKISDRIQFEDGEDLIAACNEATDNVSAQSSRLKRFLKVNPHLHSLTCKSDSDSFISHDDDIWLFNCPHEINILALKDHNLSLDNKCKIKIDSQTFVGNMDNEINRAAILTFEHNKPVIKSFVLNGIVNFRNRIPKAHFLQDDTITNNQTDFICLPETKRRHPLFGPDYQKAMKISSTIKSRLQSSSELQLIPKEGKKKKKRKYEETDSVQVVDAGDELGSEERGRKRRLSERDPDQPAKKKAKRVKQELESTQTWDSEKAIEETLFNF